MPTNKNRRGRRRTRAAGTASIDGDIDGGGDGDLEAGITAEVATETSRLLPDTPTAAQRDSDIQPDLENGLRPGLAPSSLYGTPSVTPLARSRPASLRSFHAAAQHHRAGSPNSANAEAEAAPTIATPTGSNVTSSRRAAAKAKKNAAAAAAAKQQTTTTRRLRSKLLFALITLLLAVSVYASFVDDFMGDVEAAISCGTCIGLLLPLKALASVGDDAFVDFFVGWCTKLGVSTRLRVHTPPLPFLPLAAYFSELTPLASRSDRRRRRVPRCSWHSSSNSSPRPPIHLARLACGQELLLDRVWLVSAARSHSVRGQDEAACVCDRLG